MPLGFMDQVLHRLPVCFIYINDILVFSNSQEQHVDDLCQLFTRLDDYVIILNPAKCVFGLTVLDFLGNRISGGGICPLSTRVQVIRDFLIPPSGKKLREFLGLVNFY